MPRPDRLPDRSVAARIGASVGRAFEERAGRPDLTNPNGGQPVVIPSAVPSVDGSRYLNRHLSWLEFNARVLTLAEDRSRPLLERVKFLAIFSQNLDEFFQVRVAELDEQVSAGLSIPAADGMSPLEQLQAIRERTRSLMAREEQTFLSEVVPALREERIALSDWDTLEAADRAYLSDVFEESIFPVLCRCRSTPPIRSRTSPPCP